MMIALKHYLGRTPAPRTYCMHLQSHRDGYQRLGGGWLVLSIGPRWLTAAPHMRFLSCPAVKCPWRDDSLQAATKATKARARDGCSEAVEQLLVALTRQNLLW